jgi:cytosol alanyl aminopeptidase
MRFLAFLALGLSLLAGPPAMAKEFTAPTASPQVPRMRLPGQVTPMRYALELTLVPTEQGFSGVIDIDLQIKAGTRLLWINGNGLMIDAASMVAGGVTYVAQVRSEPEDFVGLAFEREVPAGPATLNLRFKGSYAVKETRGLFKQREGGEWYVFTQFEPLHARRAFPCFDEPRWKTPWQITLKVRSEHTVVANTPIVSENDLGGGFKLVRFAETKPLPTYLVAFAVGPFDIVDGGKAGKEGAALRYIVPKGRSGDARYAREVTPRILALLEGYFGSPYPFEKLDSLVIPTAFGAMENPGLVTYADNILLAKPADETIRFKQRYASIGAHELAHQWFGNLVTMVWWDDVWLNESFATWMSNKVVDKLHPEWRWQVRRVAERARAMEVDALASARKIRQPVENRHDLSNAFDGITYEKGASVLAMFEAWMGEDRFRSGVRRYLLDHRWSNATGRDFLAALAVEDPQVPPAFESFIGQIGIPVVAVTLVCQGRPRLHLSQSSFFAQSSKGRIATRWGIPICVRYGIGSKEARACMLLNDNAAQLPLAEAERCPDWIEPNHLEAGYYRSRLQGDLLANLMGVAGSLALSEQVGLLDNAAGLARSGDQSMADALALATRFAAHPRNEVVEGSVAIAAMLGDDIVPPRLRAHRARMIEMHYIRRARSLGYMTQPMDDDNTRMLRATLIDFVALRGEDASLRKEMLAATQRWLNNRISVDSLMVEPMLKAAAVAGDRTLFDRLLAEAKSTQDRRERGMLLSALGHFRDPEIARVALQVTLGTALESRDSITILQAALTDEATRRLAFDFMQRNYDALDARLPKEFTARFPYWASGFCTAAERDAVAAFFEPRMARVEGGPRNLAQALERVDICLAFKQAQQSSVAAFLEKN